VFSFCDADNDKAYHSLPLVPLAMSVVHQLVVEQLGIVIPA
jgi:hypothetical protein